MPSINLRLSEDEHTALERWAHDSHRSLQKEIVWRLFADKGVLDVVREHVVKEVEGQLPERGKVLRGNERRSSVADEHATVAVDHPRSGSCPMHVPGGTKCKVCGKVHSA